jgi:DNA repair protein RadD
MKLRPYQQAALDAIREDLNNGGRAPLVCIPTGGGKGPCIATLLATVAAKQPGERFLCTVHTQELVGQLAETFERVSGVKPGIYSASLKRKDTDAQVTFAQVQSVAKNAVKFGRIRMLVIDECDRCPMEGDGQYRTLIKTLTIINPDLRVVGFTATPYRMGAGLVYGKGKPFDRMVFDAGVNELIADGYLSPLTSKNGGAPDLSGVKVMNGDYSSKDLDNRLSDEHTVSKACDEIMRYGANRKAWLVFCSGVKHAAMVQTALRERGIEAPLIEGNTPDAERRDSIAGFKAGRIRALININVLSVGFDSPHVDMVVLLRPTMSPGMYFQQLGRGFRIAPGKKDCLVLDLAGNIMMHGPVDTLNARMSKAKKGEGSGKAPMKTCDDCQEIVPAGVRVCPACGHKFPEPAIVRHNASAFTDSPLSERKQHLVSGMRFDVHVSRKTAGPPTIKVTYQCGMMSVYEWWSVDVLSNNFARRKSIGTIASFPRVAGDRELLVVDGKLIGVYNGQRTEITTAIGCIPYCACLSTPQAIETMPSPNDPRYQMVVSRSFNDAKVIA